MALYEAFSYSLRVRYKARFCSKTTLFYLLTNILTVILPVILVYSEDYWRSVGYYREQPDIAFKHKALLVLETEDLDNLVFWSTYKNLNELIPQNLQSVIPILEHREEDFNRDDKYDELLMNIDIPLSQGKVHSVKLLLIFDYKLHMNTKLWMECAAYVYQSSPLPGSSLYVTGDLNLFQREPLIYKDADTKYNIPVVDESSRDASSLKLEHIFMQYMKRNVSTFLLNQYPVWKSGRADDKSFTITLHIRYSEQTVLYKVPLWQLIKDFITRYVAFFAIFSYIFYKIKVYVFRRQFVPSTVISPLKQN